MVGQSGLGRVSSGPRREGHVSGVVLWTVLVAYTAMLASLVQLVVLPYVFPAWHAGNGLLEGGDWLRFHQLASALADRIALEGWGTWELRPEGQAPVGIAAVLYALTVPKPWVLIPVNAALHATAAMLLVALVRPLVRDRWLATLAALPFLLYPSAMTWYAQIHKDGFSIAGSLLFMHGWVRIVRHETWKAPRWRPLEAFAEIVTGVGLAWLVRPYLAQMMQAVGLALALMTSGVLAYRAARRRLAWARALTGTALVWAALAPVTQMTGDGVVSEVVQPEALKRVRRPILAWQPSGWLPASVERRARSLAAARERFRLGYPDAGSNVDVDVALRNVTDVVGYVPRAGMLALFAPFPNQWFEDGTSPATTFMRRVTAVEMLGVYLALAFVPYSLWRWRRQSEVWLILVFCSAMMLIHASVFTNIGALYRLRYGYLMTVVAFGVAGLVTLNREYGPEIRRHVSAAVRHGRV